MMMRGNSDSVKNKSPLNASANIKSEKLDFSQNLPHPDLEELQAQNRHLRVMLQNLMQEQEKNKGAESDVNYE